LGAETNPLTSAAPGEVPLPRAPLVRVIAQVRFSSILAVRQAEFIAAFQEAIRADYPILRREEQRSLFFGPRSVATPESQVIWRFSDGEGAWRVSLTPEFVALETTAYSSRSDFIQRMRSILRAVEDHLRPSIAIRVGLRYIDRLTGRELEHIGDLVRRDMLGIVNTRLFEHAEHALSDALFHVPETKEKIRARWGHIPAGFTVDPHAIEPIEERSWILDLDMFSTEQRSFEAEALARDLERFAERIYTLFRWAVTEEFLCRYGGTP